MKRKEETRRCIVQYLDMELSDVMSLGVRIAAKLRFGWDTGINKEEKTFGKSTNKTGR